MPAALVTAGKLPVTLRQLGKWHRLSNLLQVELTSRHVAKARLQGILRHLPRETPRLSPYPLFDVGSFVLIADVVSHVPAFALAFVDSISFGHTHHFRCYWSHFLWIYSYVITGSRFLLGISARTNPLNHSFYF